MSVKPRQPFQLADESRPVTLKDLSAQIGAVGSQVTQVLAAQHSFDGRLNVFHQELAMLRHSVVIDHAPRIAAVEGKTVGQKAVSAVKWVSVAATVLTVVAQIVASFRPDIAGPIQTMAQVLTGVGP